MCQPIRTAPPDDRHYDYKVELPEPEGVFKCSNCGTDGTYVRETWTTPRSAGGMYGYVRVTMLPCHCIMSVSSRLGQVGSVGMIEAEEVKDAKPEPDAGHLH